MLTKKKSIITILMMFIMMFAAVMSVKADTATVDTGKTGTISIIYEDHDDGDQPVAGAEFTAYKIADIGQSGQYETIIPGIGFEGEEGVMIIDEYTDPEKYIDKIDAFYNHPYMNGRYVCTTSSEGVAVIRGVELGLYIVKETKPAEGYIASTPFLISVPGMNYETKGNYGWTYDMESYPKPLPTGNLSIYKEVRGPAGELNRDFHVTVTLSEQENSYPYTSTDGRTGMLHNGDTLPIKHNETITVTNIPIGTEYKIEEVEANQENYVTQTYDTTGRIEKLKTCYAKVMNSRYSLAPINNAGGGKTGANVQTSDQLPYRAMMIAGGALMLLIIILIANNRRKNK